MLPLLRVTVLTVLLSKIFAAKYENVIRQKDLDVALGDLTVLDGDIDNIWQNAQEEFEVVKVTEPDEVDDASEDLQLAKMKFAALKQVIIVDIVFYLLSGRILIDLPLNLCIVGF